MAFKDAQIQLLEETKKVSSFQFCSSLKQSFSQVKPQAVTLGKGPSGLQSARGGSVLQNSTYLQGSALKPNMISASAVSSSFLS